MRSKVAARFPSSDLALSGEATFSHKGRRQEPGFGGPANHQLRRLAETMPQHSLLPLWEKVAAQSAVG